MKLQIVLTEQDDGRWFGRIPDSDDGNGNTLEAIQNTAQDALNCLLEQAIDPEANCSYAYDYPNLS